MYNQRKLKYQRGTILRYLLLPVFLILATTFAAHAGTPHTAPPSDSVTIQGKWDITVEVNGKKLPSWLEIKHSGLRTW